MVPAPNVRVNVFEAPLKAQTGHSSPTLNETHVLLNLFTENSTESNLASWVLSEEAQWILFRSTYW